MLSLSNQVIYSQSCSSAYAYDASRVNDHENALLFRAYVHDNVHHSPGNHGYDHDVHPDDCVCVHALLLGECDIDYGLPIPQNMYTPALLLMKQ